MAFVVFPSLDASRAMETARWMGWKFICTEMTEHLCELFRNVISSSQTHRFVLGILLIVKLYLLLRSHKSMNSSAGHLLFPPVFLVSQLWCEPTPQAPEFRYILLRLLAPLKAKKHKQQQQISTATGPMVPITISPSKLNNSVLLNLLLQTPVLLCIQFLRIAKDSKIRNQLWSHLFCSQGSLHVFMNDFAITGITGI